MKETQIEDRFLNTVTGKTNTVVNILKNVYFPRTDDFGNIYVLEIDCNSKIIELTEGLLSMFKKI